MKQETMNKVFKNRKNIDITVACLAFTTIVTAIVGVRCYNFSNYKVFFWGTPVSQDPNGNPNVDHIEKFSDYSPTLKNTAGDADIYVLKGKEKGPSILILGGTHPNEPSGQLTATLLLENIHVNKGTVYIITETNRSAFTHSHPQEASPFYYTVEVEGNDRTFKFGSRATNTNQQWPNPDIYVHTLSGQKLSTNETRNINRAYPGSIDGTYTERVAYAVTQCIRENDITITIDLHEASPEYLTINAAVVSESARASGIADSAVTQITRLLDKNNTGTSTNMKIDTSPATLHGLTHRELGTWTNTLAFLFETSNASQGKYRGAFTDEEILYRNGPDKFYEKAAEIEEGVSDTADGCLYARPVSIEERCARHAESIRQVILSYNKKYANAFSADNLAEALVAGSEKAPLQAYEGSSMTTQEYFQARLDAGAFDIDFGRLDDTGSIYTTLLNGNIGDYLHAAPSNWTGK